jgi:hypothetical protein
MILQLMHASLLHSCGSVLSRLLCAPCCLVRHQKVDDKTCGGGSQPCQTQAGMAMSHVAATCMSTCGSRLRYTQASLIDNGI